jgi:ABC-type antimicrobial peptide transport system permease subunit
MEALALCLKNLGRHGWRTRVILFITLFGAFLTFVSENLIEDVSRKQSDMFGRASFGHFRIVAKDIETANTFGYYHYDSADMLKPDEIASVKAYLAGLGEVSGSMERIMLYGLFYGKEDKEQGFAAVAMDMASYSRDFTDLYYAKGEALKSGDSEAVAASWYEYEQDKSLAVGSSYVFLLPNRNGEFVDRYLTVKGGIDFKTMPKDAFGMSGLYFDLDGFRKAVGYKEALASEVVGFLSDARTMDRVLPQVASFLAEKHPRLKVVSWQDYAPIMAEIVIGFDVMMKAVEAILLVICVLLVVKLTTFSIIERYSEIGTMRALGFTRTDIVLQFALEGTIIIAAGAAIGFLLGAGLIAALNASGVSNSLTFFNYVIGNGFRPSFHADKTALVVGVFAAVALLAPLFPAIRGGRLSILTTLEKR